MHGAARVRIPRPQTVAVQKTAAVHVPAPWGQAHSQRQLSLALFPGLIAAADLEHHRSKLEVEGYTGADDLTEAEDAELLALGLKRPELRRLRAALRELDSEREARPNASWSLRRPGSLNGRG